MRSEVAETSARWLRWLAVGMSALYAVMFLYVAVRRMVYPFQIEGIESSMMTTVWRLRHGYPLYGAPSLEWAGFLYAPLFFWLSAAMSKLTGVNYAALRAVSTLSTLGSFGAIYALVWAETRRRSAAIVAAGLFAGLYFTVHSWFDFGRVDSLSVFLFLVALYATRHMHPVAAAFFWLLACAAKQTYLPLGLAAFAIEWARPRRMLMGMAALVAMVWAGNAWLNHATDRWFHYYAFGTTGELTWIPWKIGVLSLPSDLMEAMPVALGVIVGSLLLQPLRWREREGSFYAIVTFLLVGATWFVRAHTGANLNAVIPLFAWVAVLTGVAVHRLLVSAETAPQWSRVGVAMLWLAVLVQLGMHFYTPGMVLGVTKDGPARQLFQDKVRATPGDVWVVNHSFDAIQAGKSMRADMFGLDAVLDPRGDARTAAEFRQAMLDHKFAAIVLDNRPENYRPVGVFVTPPFTTSYPLMVVYAEDRWSSAPDKPAFVMLPCSALTSPAVGLVDAQHGFVDRTRCP